MFTRLLILTACCFFAWVNATAQLCTGSLGDPVLNTTFGTQPVSLGKTTTYSYTGACPNDGEYTMASTSPSCFGDTWHALSEDHTPGDVNGMMMIINASVEPGIFYRDTVYNLCSNTTYQLAVWIANILKPTACNGLGHLPNLTFKIESLDGTLLKEVNTGDIAASSSLIWKEYGSFFTTTVATGVVLILQNNAPGDCGNDLAIDDITFRPCGPQVAAKIENNTDPETFNICVGNSASLTLTSSVSAGYSNPVYQWQRSVDSGKTWTDILAANTISLSLNITANQRALSTLYRLTVAQQQNAAVLQCRIASNVLAVNVNPLPKPAIYNNSPVCAGNTVRLAAHDGNTYTWAGPEGFTNSGDSVVIGNAVLAYSGVYTATVTSAAGCSATESTIVVVNENPTAIVSSSTAICEGSSITLQSSGGTSYLWQPATALSSDAIANPIASPADTTTYIVTVTNAKGCTDEASVTLYVWKKPTANAGPDKEIMEGQTVQLDGIAGGTNVRYTWQPITDINNYQALTPMVSPVSDATYTFVVQSAFGCGTATDNVFVRVFKKVTPPNAFSPNGDGINDTWIIKNIDTYPEAKLTVFNRYGQPLYTAYGTQAAWNGTYNGKPLPVGTYYYIIDLKHRFPLLSGWVEIVR